MASLSNSDGDQLQRVRQTEPLKPPVDASPISCNVANDADSERHGDSTGGRSGFDTLKIRAAKLGMTVPGLVAAVRAATNPAENDSYTGQKTTMGAVPESEGKEHVTGTTNVETVTFLNSGHQSTTSAAQSNPHSVDERTNVRESDRTATLPRAESVIPEAEQIASSASLKNDARLTTDTANTNSLRQMLNELSPGDLIGMGGVSKVVFDVLPGNLQVAVKTVSPKAKNPVDAAIRLGREAERINCLAEIAPLNFPRFAIPTADGQGFAHQYVPGDFQKEIIVGLSFEETLTSAIDICDGLIAMHQIGEIHGDLHPTALRRETDRHLKIVDLNGLEFKPRNSPSSCAFSGEVTLGRLSTEGYQSPERRQGLPITELTDIYGTGLLIYAMAHKGQLPMDRGFELDLPKGFERLEIIVRRCLSDDSSQQFASMAEVRKAIKSLTEPKQSQTVRTLDLDALRPKTEPPISMLPTFWHTAVPGPVQGKVWCLLQNSRPVDLGISPDSSEVYILSRSAIKIVAPTSSKISLGPVVYASLKHSGVAAISENFLSAVTAEGSELKLFSRDSHADFSKRPAAMGRINSAESIKSICIAPDGVTIAALTVQGRIILLQRDGNNLVQKYALACPPLTGEIWFSHTGKYLVGHPEKGSYTHMWDLTATDGSGEFSPTCIESTEVFSFNCDDTKFLSSSMWEGTVLHELSGDDETQLSQIRDWAFFSPDGTMVFIGGRAQAVFDVELGSPRYGDEVASPGFNAFRLDGELAACSPDGTFFVQGGADAKSVLIRKIK